MLLFADHHLPLDYNNTPIAALSVSMPTFRISGEKEKEVVQILWEAKHRIEAHFQVYGVNFGIKKNLAESKIHFLPGFSFFYTPFPSPAKYSFTRFYHNS